MEVELRHLRSFVTVAEERSFGRAAARLGVAQPSVSEQMQRLETELDAELFDRSSRPIRLTLAGEALLEEAYLTLDQAERALNRARHAGQPSLGHLTISGSAWSYNSLLPPLIRAFRREQPDVRLDLISAIPVDQAEALRKEEVDVAFDQWLMDTRSLETEPLFEEPLVGVVPYDHPFTKRAPISLEELASEPFVGVARATLPNLFAEQAALFQRMALRPRIVQRASGPLDQLGLIAAGVGVGVQMASLSRLRREGVAFISLTDAPSVTTFMLYRSSDGRHLVQRLLDAAREIAGTLDPRLQRNGRANKP